MTKLTFISGRDPKTKSTEFRVEIGDSARVKYNGKELDGTVKMVKPGSLLISITNTQVTRWFDRTRVLNITCKNPGNTQKYLAYATNLKELLKQAEGKPKYTWKIAVMKLKLLISRVYAKLKGK